MGFEDQIELEKIIREKLAKGTLDEKTLALVRSRNNPEDKPAGHYTGRCGNCGSKDLWDDAAAYGCNVCKAMYTF